ncbi:hypothetical protein AVEN_101723-1 [Araneus ventricosus]|uniref:Uncharacterized protein n=1 Tax=Araneus ventricosus TaxID=182803 RepID=A0A4Y2X913_ARAVE|nr:hypothetical protein AVEN_101723-1 [Araneus ventricosus]
MFSSSSPFVCGVPGYPVGPFNALGTLVKYEILIATLGDDKKKPAGVFCPNLSRILPQKGAASPPTEEKKKLEPTVTQNPMTIRRFSL